jgi:hypothetical protein
MLREATYPKFRQRYFWSSIVLGRITCIKDVVLYEAIPIKFVSSFLELYCIFYEF